MQEINKLGAMADEALARERLRSFVLFQIIFWGANLVIRTAAAAQTLPEFTWTFMPSRVAIVLAGAAVTTFIHVALSQYQDWSTARRLGFALVLCALLLGPMHMLERALALAVAPDFKPDNFTFSDYVFQFGWVFFMWAGYYFAQDYAFRIRRQAAELTRAQAAAHQAQIKMLRYQLNPHFLFNTLNALSTLVLEQRNADAEKMILRLSHFMRHTIDTDPAQLARLDEEARVQLLYLEIEAARFGDRLRVECDVPPALADCLVPSLILQPIVENCIKHAISPSSHGGLIRIGASERGGRLQIFVEDDGPGMRATPERRGAIGLRNTRERLATIYDDDASVHFEQRAEGGLRVAFSLPIQRQAETRPVDA
ncbi:MAG: histidine kinase [Alphaproteobacteria bacterium]|nr:histidine kinase [Alphaproteobacteria bacterium]